MTQHELIEHIDRLFCKGLNIVARKNKDYSGTELSDAFKNFRMSEWLSVPVPIGILVRISDKLARLSNLIRGETPAVKDEAVTDTILDAINYLAILHAFLTSEGITNEEQSTNTNSAPPFTFVSPYTDDVVELALDIDTTRSSTAGSEHD
jgi:hypothetical protein